MRDARRIRRLVVRGAVFHWTVRHRHSAGRGDCREVLTLGRDRVRIRIVFRSGPGRVAADGAYAHSGQVDDEHGNSVNLHEPRVVRAFVDEAAERALLTSPADLDGWLLLPGVAARLTAAPAVSPPDPPGRHMAETHVPSPPTAMEPGDRDPGTAR